MLIFYYFHILFSGKSTIFEAPLRESSKSFTMQRGCGRFEMRSKPVLLVNDKPIDILYHGEDVDVFKGACRGEAVSVKVHSITKTLPAVFIFFTSNQHLLCHTFDTPDFNTGWPRFSYPGQGDVENTDQRFRVVDQQNLSAIKARFIELFVRDVPTIPEQFLSSSFNRVNCIMGIYPYVIDILLQFEPEDYKTPYLYLYSFNGICENIFRIQNETEKKNIQEMMCYLIEKYKLDSTQKFDLISKAFKTTE